MLLVSVVALIAAFGLIAAPATAGTTSVSSFTKTGTDAATGSTVSGTSSVGKTAAGDTINWVLNYQNRATGAVDVNVKDPVAGNQTYVPGSLKVPSYLSPQSTSNGGSAWTSGPPPSTANGVGATGSSVAANATSSSPFSTSAVSFSTPGGDGFTVEMFGGNVYTVFHHNAGATQIFCATLQNGVCPGWPAHSTNVAQAAGSALGSETPGTYTTGLDGGSFIANGKLYFPTQDVVPVGTSSPVGIQCLDLTSNTSCGFTQLDTALYAGIVTSGDIGGSGLAASNGNYYFLDGNGKLLCFNPSSGACGSPTVSGPFPVWDTTEVAPYSETYGQYVIGSYLDTNGQGVITCYDTSTNAVCPGFPQQVGPRTGTGIAAQLQGATLPTYSATGALTGFCINGLVTSNGTPPGDGDCFSFSGTAIANPYPTNINSGSSATQGTKVYVTSWETNAVTCYDFSKWTGAGTVPACSGFTPPAERSGYTVRSLPALPGCLAGDGDAGQIVVFDGQTGGPCTLANTQVKMTPQYSYCDGQSHAAPTWGTLALDGVSGSEWSQATVTLQGSNGPVAGFDNLQLSPGQTVLDLSSIPVSGSTATLTAVINLVGVNNSAKVGAATASLSWAGAPSQVCFQTMVGPAKCSLDQSIGNDGNAISSVPGGASDAPAGDDSGEVTFLEAANPADSSCKADLSITKRADGTIVGAGGQVMYTLVVQNHGPETATKATESDAIPAGLNVVSAQPTQGTCTTTGSIDCSLGTIPNGAQVQILVTANVASTASGSIQNCANTSAFQPDPVASNNSSCATIIVPPPPNPPPAGVDVQVVKHVNHKVSKLGQPLTYTLDVKNNGPGIAPDVRITDTSRVKLKVRSVKASQGSCVKTAPFTCNLGPLGPGKTAKITIKAAPIKTGTEINDVTTTPGCTTTGACPPDSKPQNNVSAAKTRVNKPKVKHVKPRLKLVKTVARHVVKAGSRDTYHLKVSDPTSVAVKKVKVCDRLPLGLVYVRSHPRAHLHNGLQCWSLGMLRAHKSRTIKLVVRALSGASGRRVNHATATGKGVRPAHAKQAVRIKPKPKPPTPVTG